MCEIGLCYQVRFRTFRGIYISFVVKYNKKARKDCTRMGNYLNPDNSKFQRAVNSDIYVDKTGLIKYTNHVINTMQAYVCVSRPRRFGKSMAADMLTAYYSRGCDSRELFAGLEIAKDENFGRYLNKYDTSLLNIHEFLSRS